jgi:hypothetical protein
MSATPAPTPAPFAAPTLALAPLGGPERLTQTLRWLGGAEGGTGSAADALGGRQSRSLPMRHDDAADAEAWLAVVADGGKPPPCRNPRLLRALIKAYPGQPDPFLRSAILNAALRGAQRVTWRSLWLLWEHADDASERAALIPTLVSHLQAALLRRPSRRADLPGWLGIDDAASQRRAPARHALPQASAAPSAAPSAYDLLEQAKRMESALRDPVPYIAGWVLRQGVPIEAILPQLGCAPSSRMGQHVLRMLAAQAPVDWWTAQPLRARFAWAERCGLAIVQAVAERELLALAARAGGPSRVHVVPERAALRGWITDQLGTPAQHPGRWEPMSRRAVAVFGWLEPA